ncbi:metal ABC transporter ATP-binding protein [Oceanidesulfovibrio indonesiensis]|uniref:Metal ABC transporter ATP-binding protein n=1 Tax=Oceanidesulfovibrio indonesiensis TaxID=54767 RepID=A0A7M3MJ71_9BACT|nr:metal ABC transporter ATP-binding protein [Oceanidesulfovibrio indonesiensis]TVM19517.1 metal ABC transporter ATP-binding protein [Oceanidesulfovibrio indonesiensis]
MTTPAVEIRDLWFSYGSEPVLQGVSMTLEHGKFLVMVGPNGGGKTTLIKCMLGLLVPTRGTVRILGRDPVRDTVPVGYVPQRIEAPSGLPVSVLDVVLMGLSRRGFTAFAKRREDRRKALNALERVQLSELAGRSFESLSGGQKQRALVARALVADPRILIFDEPTANIDPQGKLCLYELLASLAGEISVVLVSHDLVAASARVDALAAVNRKLILGSGRNVSEEMLTLLYGVHSHPCPMDDYLKGIASSFGEGLPTSRDTTCARNGCKCEDR